MKQKNMPLVYSCSGCSSAAQMANAIAVKMDREKLAEMSCIAGVGGNVKPLVNTATSGRDIIAIDGCPLACCHHCLAKHDVQPTYHFLLHEFDVKKRKGIDPDEDETNRVYERIVGEIKDY
ncbi:putative zinc-binding protein [Alkalihalobacterium bogoriense]|uniref:putative zinc-binding protein n=1 Tax=Alkalihalobacterium bogoriense TaxID=246272 RepID=UPI00047E02BA|nr:putative zinc-binding protein [Alkalihalobacterium bogoriense]